jgi:Zn-dependent peptidase ImmA (M78 family)
MRTPALESAAEVEHVVRNLLRESKAWGVFPTPIESIAAYSNLVIDRRIDLRNIEAGFIPRNLEHLRSAMSKILGIIDRRERRIYLDESLPAPRKAFVKLHEIGHGVLPWQAINTEYSDDEKTISPEVTEMFEREANHFASASLFQLDRFDEEVSRLPLSFSSIRALSQKFGASVHATARRYVERCPKRCAMLVFNPPASRQEPMLLPVRNCFESPPFTGEFGRLGVKDVCDSNHPFVQDILRGRRVREDGVATMPTERMASLQLDYHFFNSTYNSFVLFLPPGETIRSRVRIIDPSRS